MARVIGKLTALAVSKANKRGAYGDGGGLWLQVGPTGAKSWLFRFMINRKSDSMGLGPLHTVSLAEARDMAAECRKLVRENKNPREERNSRLAEEKLSTARAMTFKQCAEAYISVKRSGWKNAKHASQWENTLKEYAYPFIGNLSAAAIETDLVMKCLLPIWSNKTETASRVRNRIELILDWATANKYRKGENPARWRGHLDKLLPPPRKVTPVEHFPALPYTEIGTFISQLRQQKGKAAKALELLILTAVRTEIVLKATWDEIDLEKKIWIIPAERMKIPREHRVPLSKPAIEILKEMEQCRENNYVFPGYGKKNGHLSSLDTPLDWLKRNDITAHGFRSTFRDWAAETTNYPNEVSEMALAHAVGDKVEAAYRRGNLFQKRIQVMDDWANYCDNSIETGKVISIRNKAIS